MSAHRSLRKTEASKKRSLEEKRWRENQWAELKALAIMAVTYNSATVEIIPTLV